MISLDNTLEQELTPPTSSARLRLRIALDAKLATLITENTPTRLIAMKLGRTEDAIRDKVAAKGFSLAPTNRSPRD